MSTQGRAGLTSPQGQGHTVLEQTWELLRQLTKDRDLVTACVFAGVGLLASLSLAISWPAWAQIWVKALAHSEAGG
jgi:hypothetical protein